MPTSTTNDYHLSSVESQTRITLCKIPQLALNQKRRNIIVCTYKVQEKKTKHNTVAKKHPHCYHLILSCSTFHFIFSASVARSSSRDWWWTWTSEALKWLWTVLFIYCQKSVRKIDRYLAKCCFLVSYKTNSRKLWLRCGGGWSEAVHKNNNTDIYKTREKYRENICRPFCSHLSSLAPPPTLLFSTRTSHNHQDHIINRCGH